jgi:fibro-slime domain-containing protein
LLILSIACCTSACSQGRGEVGNTGGIANMGGIHIAGGADGRAGAGGGGGMGMSLTLPAGIDAGSSTGGTGGARTATTQPWPPPGYINVKNGSYGAYALSPTPLTPPDASAAGGSSGTGGKSGASDTCGGLYGVVRDFKMKNTAGGHPDFEREPIVDDLGIVAELLGDDGKPVYAHPGGSTATTTSKDSFDQWYRDVPGVNMTYLVGLHFVPNGNVLTFAASKGNTGVPDSYYFPLDGQGFGDQYQEHNYGFTTEIHTNFTYNGGETFTFVGDDDVFVFINKHLAIDLGGIHGQENKTVDLDAQAAKLEIVTGNVYPLAVFNAERHTSESNFRVDTTMAFTDCGQIDGVPIVIY